MYVLLHLLAGVLTGLALTLVFRDRWVIVMAAVGSVLPDLIDKPLGHIFLANTLDYGRIYCHTLLFFSAFLIAGLLLSLRYQRVGPLILALVAGILSHQLLDYMWAEPVNWFWPFFGPFQGAVAPGFITNAFFAEILNPSEWVAGLLALFLLILGGVILLPGLFGYFRYVAVAGIVFGIAAIITGIFIQVSPLTLLSFSSETIITGLVIILGAVVLWYQWPKPLHD
jgi:hypothetical protein